jgi:hypothetical protein
MRSENTEQNLSFHIVYISISAMPSPYMCEVGAQSLKILLLYTNTITKKLMYLLFGAIVTKPGGMNFWMHDGREEHNMPT